tara:strand:- start:5260 stop:5535 length:276 start_codon:yes stop_codon:yes gene_type:complete
MQHTLTPFNRHILVKKEAEQNQDNSLVLVPDDYKVAEAFTIVSIVTSSKDCRNEWLCGHKVVVPTHTIETLKLHGQEQYIVSENHVLLGFE